jgi:hypothetical protein
MDLHSYIWALHAICSGTGYTFALDDRLKVDDPDFIQICKREREEEIHLFSLVCMATITRAQCLENTEKTQPAYSATPLVESPCAASRIR